MGPITIRGIDAAVEARTLHASRDVRFALDALEALAKSANDGARERAVAALAIIRKALGQ